MRAVVMSAPGEVAVTTLADPVPEPGQVVVEVAAVGLCGTDLHVLAGEHGVLPVVPGHEVSGTVVARGEGARGLQVGDRVAVDPNLPCNACRQCRRGRSNLCPQLGALGVTTAGGAAELMAAPAASCVVLPEHLDLLAATLVEPLSCAVHAYDVLRAELGSRVLLYGAGTMGLMMLSLAQRTGAASVDVVDLNADRLARAERVGCTSATTHAPEGQHWDVVVDCTGSTQAVQDGLARLAPGGTFLQLGVTSPDARVELSPYDVFRREITVKGSMAVLHSFQRAVDLLAAGVVDPGLLITAQRPLQEYGEALAAFGRGEGLKTQVLPPG
jgi:2-desacetyl-2-hydroxyethyl bacteriochlorophyllide A dehydrogenase